MTLWEEKTPTAQVMTRALPWVMAIPAEVVLPIIIDFRWSSNEKIVSPVDGSICLIIGANERIDCTDQTYAETTAFDHGFSNR